MSVDERARQITRLRALMARTVANGCTEDEELAAARLVGRVVEAIEGNAAPPATQAEAVRAERQSPEYRVLLEKNILEGLVKAAVQELALGHLNAVAPPRPKVAGQPVQVLRVPEMLEAHLSMVLGIGASRASRDVLARTIVELVQDGQLPARLSVPVGE
jgi:hypothetical protein